MRAPRTRTLAAAASTPTTHGSGGSSTGTASVAKPAKVAAPGTYAVGSLQTTYVDHTRKTKKNGSAPEKPERTLPTLILYPAHGKGGFETSTAGAEPQAGPWPLVVFSHGVGGFARSYATTLRVLASAGYVVAAPDYPLSNGGAAGGATITDVAEQTRDVAFLIDQLLAASKGTGPLAGDIDPARIGIAGHSLGAITSLGAGLTPVAQTLGSRWSPSGRASSFPSRARARWPRTPRAVRSWIIHGTDDHTVNYRFGQAVYRLLGPPKYFITLPGAGHAPVVCARSRLTAVEGGRHARHHRLLRPLPQGRSGRHHPVAHGCRRSRSGLRH